MERKSAPPKITQPKVFNLNTDRRGALDRKKLSLEVAEPTKKGFKSRAMPSFPSPPSPVRSSRSIDFKGKYQIKAEVIWEIWQFLTALLILF